MIILLIFSKNVRKMTKKRQYVSFFGLVDFDEFSRILKFRILLRHFCILESWELSDIFSDWHILNISDAKLWLERAKQLVQLNQIFIFTKSKNQTIFSYPKFILFWLKSREIIFLEVKYLILKNSRTSFILDEWSKMRIVPRIPSTCHS